MSAQRYTQHAHAKRRPQNRAENSTDEAIDKREGGGGVIMPGLGCLPKFSLFAPSSCRTPRRPRKLMSALARMPDALAHTWQPLPRCRHTCCDACCRKTGRHPSGSISAFARRIVAVGVLYIIGRWEHTHCPQLCEPGLQFAAPTAVNSV